MAKIEAVLEHRRALVAARTLGLHHVGDQIAKLPTEKRNQPDAAAYLARKAAEGKTRREARRAHKRQLANRIIRRMWRDETARNPTLTLAA